MISKPIIVLKLRMVSVFETMAKYPTSKLYFGTTTGDVS